MTWRKSIIAAFLVQTILLAKATYLFRDQINPDAISYIRIAGYFLHGQTELMVSGVWGPLLSWLIVPWLLIFDDGLLAAHCAVATSAVVFLYGTYRILRAFKLPDSAVAVGTWVTVFLSVAWSTAVVTPDLLLGGLFCCGVSRLWSDEWLRNSYTALGTGLILGTAYLAKHIALPLSVVVVVTLPIIRALCFNFPLQIEKEALRLTLRAMVILGVGFLLVAGPWILALSIKYGKPTFSTIGPIQHAIVGPPDKYRNHPDHLHFYKPEPGRITVSEDPTNLPYNYWSPLESKEYALHQLRMIWNNAHNIGYFMKNFDYLHLGLISVIIGFLGVGWRKTKND